VDSGNVNRGITVRRLINYEDGDLAGCSLGAGANTGTNGPYCEDRRDV